MNRINLSPFASTSIKQHTLTKTKIVAAPTENLTTNLELKNENEISIFGPLNHEPNYAYPLIIWLHSDGQTCKQLNDLMPFVSMQNYVATAPQAPIGNFQCGYFWEQDYDSIQAAESAAHTCIQVAKTKYNINPKRIFLVGAAGGATMALRVGLRFPSLFAGIAALNGFFPTGNSPLSGLVKCRQMPIFLSHFVDPTELDSTKEQFRLLYSAGFQNVTVHEYPSEKHLTELAPPSLNRWIMEQIHSAIM